MGNSTVKSERQFNPKTRNSYSLDASAFSRYNDQKIVPSNSISKRSNQLNSSVDIRPQSKPMEHVMPELAYSRNSSLVSRKVEKPILTDMQQQNKLERLTKINDQLRKQVIEINRKLSEELQKKKKPTMLLSNHSTPTRSQSESSKNKKDKVSPNKRKFQIIALKKQLSNAFGQVERYKQQLEELKTKQGGGNLSYDSQVKLSIIEDKLAKYDYEIEAITKEVLSKQSVLDVQQTAISEFESEEHNAEVRKAKSEILRLKEEYRKIKESDRKRQKDEKVRHEVQIQMERRLRELNGDYLPNFVNYGVRQLNKEEENELRIEELKNRKKKPIRTILTPGSQTPQKNVQEGKQITAQEMQHAQRQWKVNKGEHEAFQFKLRQIIALKNDLIQQREEHEQTIERAQKEIEKLRYQKERYLQAILEQEQNGGAMINSDQQQDESQDKDSRYRRVEAGESLPDQKDWTDNQIFAKNNSTMEGYSIVMVHVFIVNVNKEIKISGFQFHYFNQKQQSTYAGKRTGDGQQYQEKIVFDLTSENNDFLQNVLGSLNRRGFIQYLVLQSAKGKVKKIGSKKEEGLQNVLKNRSQQFNLQIAKGTRPVCAGGSFVFDGLHWRVNRIAFQIRPHN